MGDEVIVIENQEVSLTKFEQFSNVQEQLEYAKLLIESKLTNFKRPEELVTVANLGRALGVSFEVAVQNINSIQGRPALTVHLMAALAKKAGVEWEVLKDCEKVLDAEGKTVDIVTTIKFYRYSDKMKRVMENTISYSWSDAVKAQYATKD
jgi:hypothetical protein